MTSSVGLYGGSLALLTDLYQLTMAYGYWKLGMADREAVFHLSYRKQPFNSGFSIACGLQTAIDFVRGFRFAPDDLSGAVELANAFVAASGRRVDWVHLPVLDRTDDAFFAPLARLNPQGARVYLGVIHNMERYRERIAAARKFLPTFGVAAYCGLGRHDPAELQSVLADHVAAARGG